MTCNQCLIVIAPVSGNPGFRQLLLFPSEPVLSITPEASLFCGTTIARSTAETAVEIELFATEILL